MPILLVCCLLAVGVAACGDDSHDQSATPAATAAPAATTAADLAGDISADLTDKPAIATPSGDPPAELESVDIVKGKGKAAKKGDVVDVQYVGNSWSTGKQFDASWDRGTQPFTFPLGAGQVIPGWDQGVAGMKEGGRRLLVIPSELAYGDQSPSPEIGPGETLVFVVDLKGIH